MFSAFFIQRPIFASVIAIIITLAGAVSYIFLPVAEFPPIAPPTIQVSATYTGANAEVVEAAVTTPLEEQINGVEGMTYMSSNSANDGSSTITVTFEIGYDLDIAAVDVLNRVETARAQLPEEVVRAGISVTKQTNDLTIVPNVYSPDGRYDDLFISNYVYIRVQDILNRLPGVGNLLIFGQRKFAMRVWLDPAKMASLGVTAEEVTDAIASQSQDTATGMIGQPPVPAGQEFQYTLTTLGRLEAAEEFADIIVRAGSDGEIVRIKDIGRVELGAESYDESANVSGTPALPIGVFQRPGTNQIELVNQVKAAMAELAERFPPGLTHDVIYDTTLFVRASIHEVLTTLSIAVGLVVLVIFFFLHGVRATLIPVIAIPVCLVGALAALFALGFSINTLTLFGMVLAVGLVVDDAIVVVENVSRHLEENPEIGAQGGRAQRHGPGHRADRRNLAGAHGGLRAGRLHARGDRPVLSPVRADHRLRGRHLGAHGAVAEPGALRCPAAPPERPAQLAVAQVRRRLQAPDRPAYERTVGWVSRFWVVIMAAFVALLGATVYIFTVLPTGFIPGGGPGLPDRLGQGARGHLPGAHRGNRRARPEADPGDARGQGDADLRRLRSDHRHLGAQRRLHVPGDEALAGAHGARRTAA